MTFDRDLFKFLFGFVGIITLGLGFLVVVGYYQLEVLNSSVTNSKEVFIQKS